MSTLYWIYGLGFLGQAFFGARLIVQLYLSEKHGRVVSPTIFWILSLIASFLFLMYGFLRQDLVIIVGQTISYFIYIRNLQLKGYWEQISLFLRSLVKIIPFIGILIWVVVFPVPSHIMNGDMILQPVMIMGTIGQLALNLRFIYQWWYSEKHSSSILPLGFWHISTWASVLVIIYAAFHPIHKIDPVLLVAQGFGIIVYIRNIFLFKKAAVSNELI